MNRAVFVDRDNTLIENSGYLADAAGVRLAAGAAEAVARLRGAGYYVVVVTNQSGVARGLIREEQLAAVHRRMQDLLRERGTGVDALYYCPYLDGPEAVVAEYRRDSDLRKPRPGMLLLAAKELSLDLANSWMIGDAERDVAAGTAVGCRTIRVGVRAGEPTTADDRAADLAEAADLILGDGERGGRPRPAAATGEVRGAPPGSGEDSPMDPQQILSQILEELRALRRGTMHADFSGAKLAGAVSQAFAICALGWGLYAALEDRDGAVVGLLAAGVFQLITLTCFVAARK